jgi:AraC-like DNA-binding protein
VDLGAARETILFSIAIGLWNVAEHVTGRSLVGDLELSFAEPAYFAPLRCFAPGAVRFDMPRNRLVFDARLLDVPLTAAEPAAFQLACEACDRALEAQLSEQSVVGRLKLLFEQESTCALAQSEVASMLGVSERTLKRKLAAHSVSYSKLLAQARKQHALRLLQTEHSVEAVAERLGYSDPTNFARAFRRWTGRAPGVVRRSARTDRP